MKVIIVKTILVFLLLPINKLVAQQTPDLLEEMRASVKKEHKLVVDDYKCIEAYLKKTGQSMAALDQSRASYDRLYKIIFTDVPVDKLKELTMKNMEAFAEIETTRLVFEDSSLALCVSFGFHFQSLSMAAGNEPL